MAKKLLMTFVDENSKKVSISVDDPKDNLTSEEVKTVMDNIISKNVFTSKGADLVKAEGAKIITTSTEEFEYEN